VLDQRRPESFVFHAVDGADTESVIPDYANTYASTIENTLPPSARDEQWLINQWVKARGAAYEWRAKQIQQQQHINPSIEPVITPFILVFDEIHLIKNWSLTLKGLWDKDRSDGLAMHVIVLGSAPLLLQRDISESLMGRYETIRMTHWSFEEMRDCFDFNLNQYIYFGGYPGPAQYAHTDETRWRSIIRDSLIEPNLVKDILALAKIEKPAVLRQLFELGCTYSGQIVAVNKLLSQLQEAGNTTTLSHYLDLLRASGLLAGLDKYANQAIRQRAAAPKLNVLNTAFLSLYSGYTFEQAQQNTVFWGHLVESCIGAHLLNTAQDNTRIQYWRESPFEVDFVVSQGQRVAALEVKSNQPKMGANKGLLAFQQKHPSLGAKIHMVGGNDLALVDALTKPASFWLEE
jgi:predicted AAA+ superfamily ATPase